MRRERRMNPKCQTRPGFDTFIARSTDLTGFKMRRITRGVSSFDYFVGERAQLVRNCKPERLGGLEIDDQLELSGLHNWEVGWFLTFENAAGVDTNLLIDFCNACSVAHQTASFGELTRKIDGGN